MLYISCIIFGVLLTLFFQNSHVENWIGKKLPWNPPPYVSLGKNGGALRLVCNSKGEFSYYRDAGAWGVEFVQIGWMFFLPKYDEGSHFSHVSGKRLHRISERQWAKDNMGYIGKFFEGKYATDHDEDPRDRGNLVVINIPS